MTDFAVWAPNAAAVDLVLADRQVAMRSASGGWWTSHQPGLRPPDEPAAIDPVAAQDPTASDYAFRLDGGPERPDPRSRRQPYGVHGRSRLVGAFRWTDEAWRGRPLAGSVLYELHVGTFTPAGTLDAAIGKLPYLVELGIDAVELLPVAAVPGRWNWGYDGVGLYAVTENYGGPAALARFVDAAHGHGLAVVLDVVHNHLGPAGNYLPEFGPYFGPGANPWGAALNLDGPDSDEVRRFVLDNALMWLRDYHLDGLRLDAVHALVDTRAVHILEELASETDALSAALGRPLWLIAESDLNDPRLVRAREAGGYGLTAQWADDVHHALHAMLTGERQGYYVDFGPLPVLAKALTETFVHDGGFSAFRRRSHGRSAADVPADRFVTFLQNHDQIGNRAQGDRLSASLPDGLLRVGAALLLCSAFTPLLFMGEEWGAGTPWQFFADPDSPQLREATRAGRQQEFAEHGWAPGAVPDPGDPATFQRSQLDWRELDAEPHAGLLGWYRKLLALRAAEPALRDGRRDSVRVAVDEGARTLVLYRGPLALVTNLAEGRQTVAISGTPVEALAASTSGFGYTDGEVSLDGQSAVLVRLLG